MASAAVCWLKSPHRLVNVQFQGRAVRRPGKRSPTGLGYRRHSPSKFERQHPVLFRSRGRRLRTTDRGRVEPKSGSDFSPETCHSWVLRDKIFERVRNDGLWPAAKIRSHALKASLAVSEVTAGRFRRSTRSTAVGQLQTCRPTATIARKRTCRDGSVVEGLTGRKRALPSLLESERSNASSVRTGSNG
jgi:hypothetical protein